MNRQATVKRTTAETTIELTLNLDGRGQRRIETGLPFLDHMLSAFARHGYFDLDLKARGDLEVDAHHTVEDIGLVLGQAIREAAGDKAGIRRYGWSILPMDDALVRVALDLSGRPYLVYQVDVPVPALELGGIAPILFREFFQALTNSAGLNLHVEKLSGQENHHIFEAVFKSFAKALDSATLLDPRCEGVPSTKGML
jgi:imidazoleglycerol-phosphate dehydratase